MAYANVFGQERILEKMSRENVRRPEPEPPMRVVSGCEEAI
jgi:hypothetical protein